MAASELRVAIHQITEGLQHRGEYECNNPTSQILGTLYDIRAGVHIEIKSFNGVQ